jgi:DNA uptake protein ComE-like DNA-binding protein
VFNPPIPRNQWAAIALLAAIVLLALLPRLHRKGLDPPDSGPVPVIVAVEGEVERPGVHLLNEPAPTLAHVLKAAGGSKKASLSSIPEDLFQEPVHSGHLISVIHEGDGGVRIVLSPMTAAHRLTLGEKLDLNEASEADLLLIPQMRSEVAAAIVQRRRDRRWKSLQELEALPGVGPKTMEKWKESLEVRSGG